MPTLRVVQAVVWSDYLCPWCYVGQARTALLERLGVSVVPLPYELHPELPAEGREVSDRARLRYEHMARLAEEAGLPFRIPDRVPNTRDAHRALLWARATLPAQAVDALHRALFDAMFVAGAFLGDPAVVDEHLACIGADPVAYRAAVADGALDQAVTAAREDAIDAGATGAPAWLVDGRLLIAGVQDPAFFERMVARLASR